MGTASPVNGLIAYEPLKTPVTLRSACVRVQYVSWCGQGRRLLLLSGREWSAGLQITFRSQNHEGHTEHGICTGSKDGKFEIAVFLP